MADPQGFLKTRERELPRRRPVPVRIKDWKEVYEEQPVTELQRQAGRCMDCGIPFCHSGCPLGNLIPEWNDLAWKGEWRQAIDRLHARSFHSGMRLPSGQPLWQKGIPQSMQRPAWRWSSVTGCSS